MIRLFLLLMLLAPCAYVLRIPAIRGEMGAVLRRETAFELRRLADRVEDAGR